MDEVTLRERHPKTPDDISPPPTEMTVKEAYFQQLRLWVHQANMSQQAVAQFPYYLISTYPQIFQPTAPQPPVVTRHQSAFDPIRNESIINANGGYEYNIAPLFKRFLAELVDVLILFLIKLMVTFAIVDLFDIKLGIDLDFDSIKNSLEDDYTELLSFTSDLVIAETITKIVVCFYEALWTASGGATPGKMLLGIRILYVEAVVPLEAQPQMLNMNQNQAPLKALLFPASNPGFRRSLVRAIAKNIIMTILFPMYFVMFFFKNNRTGYDLMTKTIVVEENIAPIFHRRR